MSTDSRTLETELFGQAVRFDYSERWVGYSLFLLRVVMGWTLFQGGITKLVTYLDSDPSNNWTAAGYLANAIPEGNPLMGLWSSMAGSPLIDMLNMWGLTLAGLALILGAFVRFSAFWGAVMMLFYWAAALEGGILAGLPLAHGWVVDDHIVYAVLLFGLGAFGAGRILGVDAYLENMEFVRRNRWMSLVMG
ncbi:MULTISPECIES: DoxX family protein [Haloferax]|uniref:DoxX family protein n=1 Tax=Haloferax volcanii TaxID=2246 RepID=A0A6C0UPN0_HALVO|nr:MULTISPECIES: DoxX family protein [Haloferax]MBC9985698.1 DoxX family protein [Haloferax sp. AS1]QIB77455.1 DoxX family protein [Haloferax alexandrinus]RDZ32924.1 DoxX family protein [Haloferax sp. Atlit-48N]RDZ37390.1 DoxX family protein [Haloferax sp. Atlit-24N]RDZ41111.1 DoxX family protein [Haloferax sp. Atlit-47N]